MGHSTGLTFDHVDANILQFSTNITDGWEKNSIKHNFGVYEP